LPSSNQSEPCKTYMKLVHASLPKTWTIVQENRCFICLVQFIAYNSAGTLLELHKYKIYSMHRWINELESFISSISLFQNHGSCDPIGIWSRGWNSADESCIQYGNNHSISSNLM
jgi:hypothetical protein